MKHTIDEIKTENTKLAHRHLMQINRLLDDVCDADNTEWKLHKVGLYMTILDIVHVNGKHGSLLINSDN